MGRRVVGGMLVAGVLVGLLAYVLGSRPKRALVPDRPQVAAPAHGVRPGQAPGGFVLPSWLVHPELPGQRIAGRVVRDEKPVPDAFVMLRMSGVPDVLGDRLLRSDAQGRFDFGTQPAAGFLLVAWAPAAVPASRYLDLTNPADRSAAADVELVLSECKRSAFGRVRDAEGTPIAKARVRADYGPSVETGDDGRFEICFATQTLEVSADGYGTVLRGADRSPIDVSLVPEAGINGVVLAPDDTPAPRAIVSVWSSGGNGGLGVSVAADDTGRFQVRGLAGGLLTAMAAGEGAVPRDEVQVAVEPGTVVDVTLRLAPASTLRGVVLVGDAPASVRLRAASRRTLWNVATTSGADGSFVLGPVPFEEIRFSGAGAGEPPDPSSFRATRALHDGLTLRFPLGATIRGRVLRDGRPAVGATVSCGQVYVRVDGAGQYVCEWVTPQETLVAAFTERDRSEPVTVTATAGEVKEVNLELVSPGTSVSGVVVDEEGEPVVGVQVMLVGRDVYASSEPTTRRGEFRAEHVAPGTLQVAVLGEDGRTHYSAPNRGGLPRVEVADRDVKDVRVIIRRPKLLTIAGRVVDAAGAPVPDARIDVTRLEPGMDLHFATYDAPRCISDRDGRFVLDRLVEGTYGLRAATATTARTVRDVPAGARNVVIALPASASIEGRVIGFRAPERVDALARNVGPIYLHAELLGDSFRFPSLAPGRYLVAVVADDGGAAAEVEVAPGSVARVTLVGRGVGSVVVRVVDPRSSQPIPGAQCWVSLQVGKDGSPFASDDAPPTDSKGETLLARVPGGDLIVSCYHRTTLQQWARKSLSLAPGQTAVVELSLLRRRGPGGTMFDASVGPRDGAAVIWEVGPESNAARAGFLAGDVIVAVDGAPTAGLDPGLVDALIADRPVGALAAVTVLRGGETLTLSVAIVPER